MTVEKTNEEPARDGKECIINLLSYYDLHYSRAGDIGEMSQRFGDGHKVIIQHG